MEDLEELKKAVSNKQYFEPIGATPLPHETVDLRKVSEDTPKTAPIFVRVDRYKEILARIQELKNNLESLTGALAVRKSIHKINAESDAVLEQALQRFADSTSMFGQEFVTPRGPERFGPKEELQQSALDSTISEVSQEISKLKLELEKIKL
jgi:hypothetical protein